MRKKEQSNINLVPPHDILDYDYYITSYRHPIRKGELPVNSVNINYMTRYTRIHTTN